MVSEPTEAARAALLARMAGDAGTGERVSVDAALIAAMLAGEYGAPPDPAAPISIIRADVAGELSLALAEVAALGRPLRFVECRFDAPLQAAGLHAPSLTLERCVLPAIDVRAATLERLELDGCRLGRSQTAGKLDAADLKAAEVTLRALIAHGHAARIVLDGARVETLRLADFAPGASDARLSLHAAGLRGESLTIENAALGSVTARELAVGSVRIVKASIAGHCEFDSLEARRLEVLRGEIGGALRFERARVRDHVSIIGCTLGSGKAAIVGDHAVIEGALTLGNDPHDGSIFVARGAVRLQAATIEQLGVAGRIEQIGGLDLQRARIETVTIAEGASVSGARLDRATLGALVIEPGATLTAPLRGRRLHVAGLVSIAGAFTCEGTAIALASAQIDDALHFGREFNCAGAIQLDYCQVSGDVTVRGAIRRPGANAIDIAGLRCERLTLDLKACEGGVSIRRGECGAMALRGEYRCPPDLPLHIGVACKGRVAIGDPLLSTRVEGTLSLIDTTCRELLIRRVDLTAPREGRWTGMALAARHLATETLARIGHPGDADGVRASGAIAFDYASFGDDLRLVGLAAGGLSLHAASVRGNVLLGEAGEHARVSIGGAIDLGGAKVGGDVVLGAVSLVEGRTPPSLSLVEANVAGALRVGRIGSAQPWRVDLEGARVGTLDDRGGLGWEEGGGTPPRLALATLDYSQLADLAGGSNVAHGEAIAARLAWIERHAAAAEPGLFRAAPYHTLASVLEAHGDLVGVKSVEVAARRAKRRGGGEPAYARLGDWLFDMMSGYGYAPGRALSALLIWFAIGWAGVEVAEHQGAFQPSPKLESGFIAAAVKEDPHGCVWLEPPLYTVDVMLPVVSLDEEDLCSIRPDRHAWSWARAAYRIIGSILVSVALLTFSGLLKRERE